MNKNTNTIKIKYTTKRTLNVIEQFIYVSDGNKKLKSTSKVSFLIWNIPARITCPYATEHCKKFCYAVKSETAYKDVKPCRIRNWEFSRSADFVPTMIEYISIKLNHLRNGKRIFFRIHESGDFYNKAYVMKWFEIMRYFANDKRLVFMAYTKSVRFFTDFDFKAVPNFVLRYSIWDDTKPEEIAIAKSLNLPIYTAFTAEEMKKHTNYFVCKCDDCANCAACYQNGVKMIACEIH